jgi:hypothetical protein
MKIIASIFKTLFVIYIVSLVLVSTKVFAQCPTGTWSLNVTINPDQYPEETSWYIMTFFGDTLMQGGPYTGIIDYEPQYAAACAPIDSFYIVIEDLYGDGVAGSLWGGNDGSIYIEQCGDTLWSLPVADFGYQIFDTIYTSGCPPPPPVFGCMDPSYVEFDIAATLDTGMCFTPRVYGCTDSLAYNYIDSANTDVNIDSCMHELELTDLAGNGWAGSSLKLSQATSLLPPFNYQDIGTYTLLDGFDTTFFVSLAAGYPVRAVFEITQQSDFTAVQCGYSLYSEDYVAIDIEGGFVNPIPPFFPVIGEPYCGNTCVERVYGCTDVSALNYNALANTDDSTCYYLAGCTNPIYLEYNSNADYDDGSCATLVILGCMDSTAYNYDPTANVELIGSCVPYVYGCMDPVMFNYDPLATASDTCIPYVYGCTDASMFNYDINANTDNGSCIPFVYGCTDDTMYNYDPLANSDNGTCVPFVYGCTEAIALNFDVLANTNDGSCIYPYLGCTDSTAINYEPTANVDDGSCVPFIYGCTDPTAFNFDATANTDDNSCIEVIYGCMDPTMFNYNPDANTSNSSCIPFYYGCMDSTALNYDDDANTDNGSCIYAIYGCNDPTAINYDPLVNTPDSSCEYSAGCAIGDVYTLPNPCFAWVIDVDEYCCDVAWDPGCVSLYEYCQDGWTGPTDIIEVRYGLVTYPNPTSDYIYINSRLKVDITVINMLGDVVMSKEKVNVLDVFKLTPGVYNILIEHENIKVNKKIIKQ